MHYNVSYYQLYFSFFFLYNHQKVYLVLEGTSFLIVYDSYPKLSLV